MLSHVVLFYADPAQADAVEQLEAGCEKYLRSIPGVLSYHTGRPVPSHRPVVDGSYSLALNLIFPDKEAESVYQVHPQHLEFIEHVFKKVCVKAVVYDFA
jgi:hypothetical protein